MQSCLALRSALLRAPLPAQQHKRCLATAVRQPLSGRAPCTFRPHGGARSMATAAAKEVYSADEVAQLVADGKYTFLDVRSPEEFKAGHAPDSINIPWAFQSPQGMQPNPKFVSEVEQQFPDKAAPLVVSCARGQRSTYACQMLEQAQYNNLVNAKPGWVGWAAAGLPVET